MVMGTEGVGAGGPPSVVAAVFDLDGTLVDSMPAQFEAYRRAFADHGADLGRETFDEAVGATADEVMPVLLAATSCEATVAEIRQAKARHLPAVLDEGIARPLPAAQVATALGALVPIALCTSASAVTVDILLERQGWGALFTTIVTGDDVVRGKPDPEPYLLVAERLGVDPRGCLAFEDAPAGLSSARAAGMAVVDVGAP